MNQLDQEFEKAKEHLAKKNKSSLEKAKKRAYFDVCVKHCLRDLDEKTVTDITEVISLAKWTRELETHAFFGKYRKDAKITQIGKVVFTAYRKYRGNYFRSLSGIDHPSALSVIEDLTTLSIL